MCKLFCSPILLCTYTQHVSINANIILQAQYGHSRSKCLQSLLVQASLTGNTWQQISSRTQALGLELSIWYLAVGIFCMMWRYIVHDLLRHLQHWHSWVLYPNLYERYQSGESIFFQNIIHVIRAGTTFPDQLDFPDQTLSGPGLWHDPFEGLWSSNETQLYIFKHMGDRARRSTNSSRRYRLENCTLYMYPFSQ